LGQKNREFLLPLPAQTGGGLAWELGQNGPDEHGMPVQIAKQAAVSHLFAKNPASANELRRLSTFLF
jgi:hypothetical protein